MPLCDDWPRDEQIWAYNPTGRFTVCSSYKLVHQAKINVEDEECSSESAMEKFWTCLWGLSIAPKIKIPLWKVYNNILPTRKNLSRRLPTISAICSLCSEAVEVLQYIFFRCCVMLEVWKGSHFSHMGDLFQANATTTSILERILDWLE